MSSRSDDSPQTTPPAPPSRPIAPELRARLVEIFARAIVADMEARDVDGDSARGEHISRSPLNERSRPPTVPTRAATTGGVDAAEFAREANAGFTGDEANWRVSSVSALDGND